MMEVAELHNLLNLTTYCKIERIKKNVKQNDPCGVAGAQFKLPRLALR